MNEWMNPVYLNESRKTFDFSWIIGASLIGPSLNLQDSK